MRTTFSLAAVSGLLMAHCGAALPADAGETPAPEDTVQSLSGLDAQAEVKTTARDHLGVLLASKDDRFSINVWMRGQFRFYTPFDRDPQRAADFDNEPGDSWEIRRARIKAEGHLFTERLGFSFEHELMGNAPLLDLRLDLDFGRELLVRAGQYKVLYNRERIDSSGKQQFAERSIANYAFTVDRQLGVSVAKHWAPGTRTDNWLMVGVFEGDGIDAGQRGDEPMLVARWQWQFLGERLSFSQSDHNIRDKPAASLAFAASTVRGPYTRFSSSGGGQLDGFATSTDERYTLKQWMQEFAWQYHGMSFQQEFHVKRITDHETSRNSTLTGGYAQVGKAMGFDMLGRRRSAELALRTGYVDWENTNPSRIQRELTLAANLFLSGHNHKLTAEASRVGVDEPASPGRHDMRYRLQWDVSF